MEYENANKMGKRILDGIKMNKATWDELQKDLENKEPKDFICRKFGIKPCQFKWLKRYLRGDLKC